jgi:hypothetical protein
MGGDFNPLILAAYVHAANSMRDIIGQMNPVIQLHLVIVLREKTFLLVMSMQNHEIQGENPYQHQALFSLWDFHQEQHHYESNLSI